jgi:hypothetical protein
LIRSKLLCRVQVLDLRDKPRDLRVLCSYYCLALVGSRRFSRLELARVA